MVALGQPGPQGGRLLAPLCRCGRASTRRPSSTPRFWCCPLEAAPRSVARCAARSTPPPRESRGRSAHRENDRAEPPARRSPFRGGRLLDARPPPVAGVLVRDAHVQQLAAQGPEAVPGVVLGHVQRVVEGLVLLGERVRVVAAQVRPLGEEEEDLADRELGRVELGQNLDEANRAGRLRVPLVPGAVEPSKPCQVAETVPDLAPRARALGAVIAYTLYFSTASRIASMAHPRCCSLPAGPAHNARSCVRR